MKKIFTLFAALACVMSMFAATETVYFVNADKWTGTINAYAWAPQNANWPGVAATKEAEQIAGCDVYSYTAEAGTYANVIFNNGSKQTADLTWTAGKYFVRDGWYTKEEAATKLGQPVEQEYVYFVNNKGWKNVNAYAWAPQNANWPGEAATKEAEQLAGYDVYSYAAPAGTYQNVIFNGEGGQTADMVWTAGKYIVDDQWYTKEEAAAKLSGSTPVDPKPQAYYVTGNDALFGANAWNAAAIAMTENNGVYTHTFTAVAAGVECQLKVTNGTWDASWGYSNLATVPAGVTGNNDNNIIFTLAEAGDVEVTFSAEKITITGNFKASENPVEVTYVLMGVGGDWTTGIALTPNPDNANEYMLLNQAIAEGDAVKVVTLTAGSATAWCGNVEESSVKHTADDMGNIILTPGAYDFYYKVAEDIIYIGTSTTDVDNVTVEKKAVKVVRNGQLFIIRDNVTYNVLGHVAE